MGQPPAADEPGMSNSNTALPSGTIGQGETRTNTTRGTKRESDGDDQARDELQREEDAASDAPMGSLINGGRLVSQKVRVEDGGSRSNRAGDRHSGHCESKPRTAELRAALAMDT